MRIRDYLNQKYNIASDWTDYALDPNGRDVLFLWDNKGYTTIQVTPDDYALLRLMPYRRYLW